MRLSITIDAEHAATLARLAKRAHVPKGTLARALLSSALDDADPDARNIVSILDGIPGAYERAQRGLSEAEARQTTPLDAL